jgi:8-oxo-dGTP diphosphatase
VRRDEVGCLRILPSGRRSGAAGPNGSRLPDAGSLTLHGGHVEFGEHPDDAVLRELREETGLIGERGQVVAVYSHTYERSPTHPRPPFQHLGLIYEVRAEEGELLHEVGDSTDLCQ